MVFVDSKAPIRASARRDQWADRSIDRSIGAKRAIRVQLVRYVFGQSGRREGGEGGCTTPSCPAGTVTPLPRTHSVSQHILAPTHADTRTRTASRASLPPAMYTDARVLVTIDTDQIPKILRQPERTRPRAPHRDACCARCRPTKLSADFAPSTLRCTMNDPTSAERCHGLDIASAGSPTGGRTRALFPARWNARFRVSEKRDRLATCESPIRSLDSDWIERIGRIGGKGGGKVHGASDRKCA